MFIIIVLLFFQISDALRAGKPDTYFNRFSSLQLALFAGPVFAFFSFLTYLIATLYVEQDRLEVINLAKSKRCFLNSDIN